MFNVFDDSCVTELSQSWRAPNFYDDVEQGVVITNNCDGRRDKVLDVQKHKQANVDPHYDVLSRGEDFEIIKKKTRYIDAMAEIARIVESLFWISKGAAAGDITIMQRCRVRRLDFV